MTDVVTPADFETHVLEASATHPVVVDFWAPWCAPCRVLTPALEKAIAAHGGKIALVKVNTDEAQELASAFQVSAIPSVKAFRDGKLQTAFEGARDAAFIARWLGELLPTSSALALEQARGALRRGDAATAEPLLAAIDPRSTEALEVDALRAVVALIGRSPAAARGDWAVALEELYQAVAERRPEREQALAELRAVFELLGSDDELAPRAADCRS
jgi:thioredoxin